VPPKKLAPDAATLSPNRFRVGESTSAKGERIVIYGPGCVGKTSLAALAPHPLFFDFDGGVNQQHIAILQGVETWQDLRDALHSSICHNYETIVLDSVTKVQELCLMYTLKTVPHEKGHFCSSVEGYGYGKGYQYVYETFLHLLSDLEDHSRAGRHVVLVCHSVEDYAPNPAGEDYQRYEPQLQKPPKQGRIRDRVVVWADHVLFVNFDVYVGKGGKAVGGTARTIYPTPMATHIAKSRTLRDSIVYDEGSDLLWQLLLNKTEGT
jgi:hypothetical protein